MSLVRFLLFSQMVSCICMVLILMSQQGLERGMGDVMYELHQIKSQQEENFHILSQKVAHPIIREVRVEQVPAADPGGHGPRRADEQGYGPIVQSLPDAKITLPDLNNSLTYLPELEGENIIAMSLWGSDSKYVLGAIRNAELVKTYFPGWRMRVYMELPSEKPVYGAVPAHALTKLRELGAELNFMDPSDSNVPPMMWRFLVADDLSVDRFIIRDVDSRLSARDSAAVYQWVKSDKPFHCIRDHPSHASHAVSGGLWGGIPSGLRDMLRRQFKDIMYGFREDYFEDMNFLIQVVWPRVKGQALCVDSVSCDRWEASEPFPIPRLSHEHVGQVFDEHELARPIDIKILRDAGENRYCSPPR